MTFPPTGLSENLGGMETGRGGTGEREGWGRPPALLPPPPTGFCLKYLPAERGSSDCLNTSAGCTTIPFALLYSFAEDVDVWDGGGWSLIGRPSCRWIDDILKWWDTDLRVAARMTSDRTAWRKCQRSETIMGQEEEEEEGGGGGGGWWFHLLQINISSVNIACELFTECLSPINSSMEDTKCLLFAIDPCFKQRREDFRDESRWLHATDRKGSWNK